MRESAGEPVCRAAQANPLQGGVRLVDKTAIARCMLERAQRRGTDRLHRQADVLQHRQAGEDVGALKRAADAGPRHAPGRLAGHFATVQFDASCGRTDLT
jgi:hypothetical protein